MARLLSATLTALGPAVTADDVYAGLHRASVLVAFLSVRCRQDPQVHRSSDARARQELGRPLKGDDPPRVCRLCGELLRGAEQVMVVLGDGGGGK